jgi:type 1 glutamine amidotransferase
MDLLLDASAHAVLERDVPEFLGGLPSHFRSVEPPSITAVITPRGLAELGAFPASVLLKLDADLAQVPVTREAALKRCARYDESRPALPRTITPPAILVFGKIVGFRDNASVDAATAALQEIGARRHWTLVFIDKAGVFNPRDLRRFQAVVWNNISGDALTLSQQRAFKAYIEAGGGFAGIHGSGGDPHYIWDWYADTLIGARFWSHPMSPQFQQAKVVVDDAKDPLMQNLDGGWSMVEEWYSFKSSPRAKGARILATLDERSYQPIMGSIDLHMGDHPIAWTQCVGNGRSFYTAIGHRPESYVEPHSVTLLERGIAWAAGIGNRDCQR